MIKVTAFYIAISLGVSPLQPVNEYGRIPNGGNSSAYPMTFETVDECLAAVDEMKRAWRATNWLPDFHCVPQIEKE